MTTTTARLTSNPRRRARSEGYWASAARRLIRNRLAMIGLITIVIVVLMTIFAPQIAPFTDRAAVLTDRNAVPEWVTRVFPSMIPVSEGGYVVISDRYPLGADGQGRDLFSRILYGGSISLRIAILAPLISLIIGLPYGLISGYASRRIDNLMMRFVDVMYAFPTILLIILIMAYFRAGIGNDGANPIVNALNEIDRSSGGVLFIFIGIGLTSWMGTARMVRAQVLSLRERDYVFAAISIGATRRAILFRHILPNTLGPIIVSETLSIPGYISYEAFLSFIGLGVNRPTPSWGSMIADGSIALTTYPNQAIFPALALFILMFAFNFLGDGLRDALDPRAR